LIRIRTDTFKPAGNPGSLWPTNKMGRKTMYGYILNIEKNKHNCPIALTILLNQVVQLPPSTFQVISCADLQQDYQTNRTRQPLVLPKEVGI
jgi:hypothetical protein